MIMGRDEFGLPKRRMITKHICLMDVVVALMLALVVFWLCHLRGRFN